MSLGPQELRALAAEAEYTIDYAFSEPMVAISQEDALALAVEIERLRKLEAEAARLARWCDENLPGTYEIGHASLICDVIDDLVPKDYKPPEWE